MYYAMWTDACCIGASASSCNREKVQYLLLWCTASCMTRSSSGGVTGLQSGSKADISTLTVPRRERSIVTYMQLRQGSAASADAACAPRADLARGP